MTIERWTDTMLDQLASVTRQQGEQLESLRVSVDELREGQVLLTQMFVEDREVMREFRQTTRRTLDQMTNILEEERTIAAEERTIAAEERTIAAEERTIAAEERRTAAEERTIAAEERRIAAEERRTTRAALDRIDRVLDYLMRRDGQE